MNKKELDAIIEKHGKWLKNEDGGEGADLSRANLSRADLSGADLSGADLSRADLSGADLSRADLSRANLSGADLSGANLDFSCFPIWCGGSNFKTDQRLVRQLLAHICTLEITDESEELKTVIDVIREQAKQSHRAFDLGLLEDE